MKVILGYLRENHVLTAVLAVGIVIFLIEIKGILVSLFISFIIMASILPAVSYFQRNRFPKILAVLIPYLLVIASIVLLILPLYPFFISQIQSLLNTFPTYLGTASQALGIDVSVKQINSFISPSFSSITRNAFSLTGRVFGGLFLVLTTFIVSFYLLLDHESLQRFVAKIFSKDKDKALEALGQVEHKLGAWLRGQIALSLAVGSVTWVVLSLLGIEYALPLALLAGIFEIVPTLGPIIASIPAVIVALSTSGPLALAVIGSYSLIQVLENNILVPKIMEKAVGLNPVVIIVAILIGGSLMGVVGALLAIPFVSASLIIYRAIR